MHRQYQLVTGCLHQMSSLFVCWIKNKNRSNQSAETWWLLLQEFEFTNTQTQVEADSRSTCKVDGVRWFSHISVHHLHSLFLYNVLLVSSVLWSSACDLKQTKDVSKIKIQLWWAASKQFMIYYYVINIVYKGLQILHWIQVSALPGTLKDIQRVVLIQSLSVSLLSLSRWEMNLCTSWRSRLLWSRLLISMHCTRSSFLWPLLVSQFPVSPQSHPHNMMLPPHHCGDGTDQVMSRAWFIQKSWLVFKPNRWTFVSSD